MKKKLFKISILIICLIAFVYAIAQTDPPAGHTTWFGLRYWDEGQHPGADSVNQNIKDIDTHLHNRDIRVDSLKSAFGWMFNFPSGTWKRYNAAEFDDDTLKVKPGVFLKLDSNNVLKGTNKFTSGEVKFDNSPNGSTLNFIYTNDQGGVFINKNTSTSLLKFDEGDGLFWQFGFPITVAGDVNITGSYKVNGVPFSSGGDAFLGNRQTWTKRNYFTDTLKISGIALFDSVKTSGKIAADNVTATELHGGGGDIQDITANNITIGTLPDGRLSSNVILRSKRNVYNFPNIFSDSLRGTGNVNFDSVKVSGKLSADNVTANELHGNGGDIQDITANNISIGTIPDDRLSANIFRNTDPGIIDQPQIVSLQSNFTNTSNLYYGNGRNLLKFNASHLDTGFVPMARLSDTVSKYKRTIVNNANYKILSTDRYVSTQGLTAARVDTLPSANSVVAGKEIIVIDESGTVTSSNTLTIVRSGTDSINSGTNEVMRVAYGWRRFVSNGIGKWIYDAGVVRDSASVFRIDTTTTEDVKAKVKFRDLLFFYAAATVSSAFTFNVAPVFSVLIDFANGLTTTSITASGTATFNGDLIPNSWVKTQSSNVKDQYIKEKFLRMPISTSTSAGTVTYTLHGLSRGAIRDMNIMILDDSSHRASFNNMIANESGAWAQGTFNCWGFNDTAVYFRRIATAYNFIGDTAWFHITYADTTR